MKNEKIIEIIKNGGATLDKKLENANNNSGYMVSIYGQETKLDIQNVEEIKKAILQKQKIVKNYNNLFIGLWIDKNDIYIDISINIIDKTEALEFGKKNKQLAIYDSKNNDSIYLKDYKFIKYYTIYKIVKDTSGNIIDYKIDTQKNNINELVDYFKLNIKTIKNAIYNEIQDNYKQVINNRYIIIKDYELIKN